MDNKKYGVLKAKFLKSRANVPLPLRDEIIAVVGNQTFSWNAAYGEIDQDTENAELILEQLTRIGLI